MGILQFGVEALQLARIIETARLPSRCAVQSRGAPDYWGGDRGFRPAGGTGRTESVDSIGALRAYCRYASSGFVGGGGGGLGGRVLALTAGERGERGQAAAGLGVLDG